MMLKDGREWLAIIIIILLLTDLAVLLNIPFLRQILGFLFLTLLLGFLILQALKLNKLESTEKVVLSVGLSIASLMFFGLLINNLSLSLGYETPLTTILLLISFNIAIIALAIISHRINKETVFSLPDLNLTTSEKAFLIVPILFPALSIFGMYVMNTTDSNLILMFLLFLIPIYVIFVCFFNQKFPRRQYPVAILLISISLLLLMSLRSNHIIGMDIHSEYYLFRTTLNNLHWSVFGHSVLDACLAISLLPVIYQSILNAPPEFLYKVFYPLIYSISPLVIYILSKKYVGEFYGFLASCVFMFQAMFLRVTCNPRTSLAILFFALAVMTLFSDRIEPLKKRALFIVFMASCLVSHYSTTYIFFFIILGTFIGVEILSKKYPLKKVVSLTIVVIFFAMIFFWYSQVTETAFNAGVDYIENTLISLNQFFVEESRGDNIQAMLGTGIGQKGIPHKIEFVFTWLTFALIGIGVITLIRRYKEMSFPELNFKRPDFLKDKFEVGYFMIALACAGLLVVTVALPFISQHYGIDRLYALALTILSVFFVIGGITVAKSLSFIKQTFKKSLIKNVTQNSFGKSDGRKKGSEVRAYLIILLVLIPYFFCVTGVMYNMFGVPRTIILNSEGKQYDARYIHDQESYGAKWLAMHGEKNSRIYTTDGYGVHRLMSQGKISSGQINCYSFPRHKKIEGYIYTHYNNVINGKLEVERKACNMTEYSDMFVGKSKIYSNGGSATWITK